MNVVVCSANAHKVAELHPLLPDWTLALLDAGPLPSEDGETYVDNARIKARFGHEATGAWVIADDSGIEVAALDGAPGVHTARWADGRHVEKMLAALEGRDDRSAQYVCELVLLDPDGNEYRGTGVLPGAIARAAAGDEGFGFDPIFVPQGETRTVAELGDDWKVTHSHRALAAQAVLKSVGARAPS
ncbi:MAG TPA: non-canonical purine NTP pyrophosphatase [Gaiellaceae bacterium]